MENSISQQKIIKSLSWLSDIWIYGLVVTSLVAVSNLMLFLILRINQFLIISSISMVMAGLFFLSRQLLGNNNEFGSALIATFSWIGLIVGHILFWSGINGFVLPALWIFPILILLSIQGTKNRLIVFAFPLMLSVFLFFIDKFQIFQRIPINEFSYNRFIAPIYFSIFGVLVFLFFLRSIRTRTLSLKIIISMALIVFIPIVVLTMVSYSNSKSSSTLTAVDSLSQISSKKSNEILEWSSGLALPLETLVSENDTYQLISRLLQASLENDNSSLLAYRGALEYILSNIAARYGFEELYILNPSGIVVTSTEDIYIGTDFSEYDFFLMGKEDPTLITPGYYPLEDQTSVFVSRPIFSTANEILGVISARASTEKLIEIATSPSVETYQTTSAYILNPDGTLLETSFGRSTLVVNTKGAQKVLSSKEDGALSYANIDGQPVIGVIHWLPELNIALIVEVSESEVFQRIPSLIIGNLAIGMLGFFLAVLAAVSIVRSITSPINALVDASKEVISGNFNIQLPVGREDELGILTEAFNRMTAELKVLVADLEIRVADRTRDLETRSQDLETSAIIARDASLAMDMSELMNRTAQLIQERFGFYFVGIYLNDMKNEYTILSSAAGEASSKLIALHHKLKIGETGIIGTVTKQGEPRVASDVGADAIYFQNPFLSSTRSEMTLPLIVRQQIIGALDVQSEKVTAFDQNDIRIMGVLADQLAIAIERTRLVEETIKNAAEMKLALQTQTSSAWRDYLTKTDKPFGFRYEGVSVKPLEDHKQDVSQAEDTPTSGVTTNPETPGSVATIPIRLRGSIIGTLDFQFSTPTVPAETLQYLELAAERLSLALENARLFNEVTLRAEREKNVTNITSNIRSKTDPQQMVQTALEELKKVLGASNIKIRDINDPGAASLATKTQANSSGK